MGRTYIMPCDIGDPAWGLRHYKGIYTVVAGLIESVTFDAKDVPSVSMAGEARGRWGRDIFGSRKAAEKEAERRMKGAE